MFLYVIIQVHLTRPFLCTALSLHMYEPHPKLLQRSNMNHSEFKKCRLMSFEGDTFYFEVQANIRRKLPPLHAGFCLLFLFHMETCFFFCNTVTLWFQQSGERGGEKGRGPYAVIIFTYFYSQAGIERTEGKRDCYKTKHPFEIKSCGGAVWRLHL